MECASWRIGNRGHCVVCILRGCLCENAEKYIEKQTWSDIGITGEKIYYSVLDDFERDYCRECFSVEMADCQKAQCPIFLKIEAAWERHWGLVTYFDISGIELNNQLVDWEQGIRLYLRGRNREQVSTEIGCHIYTAESIRFMLASDIGCGDFSHVTDALSKG